MTKEKVKGKFYTGDEISDMRTNSLVIGLTIMAIVCGVINIMVMLGDNTDLVDSRKFGGKICESKGLDYDHREFVKNENGVDTRVPIIYCKNQTETKLIDGVVIRVKQ